MTEISIHPCPFYLGLNGPHVSGCCQFVETAVEKFGLNGAINASCSEINQISFADKKITGLVNELSSCPVANDPEIAIRIRLDEMVAQ